MDITHLFGWLLLLPVTGACNFGTYSNCTYMCHCQNNDRGCTDYNGDCGVNINNLESYDQGCDDGSPEGFLWKGLWHGPGCQIGNVAYGREPIINGFAKESANVTVDGDLSPSSCMTIPGLSQHTGWQWKLQLEQTTVVLAVTVYGMVDTHNGLIRVFVDEAECGLLVYNQDELRARVSCQLPGNNVTIRNEEHGVETTVCEVMVEGYKYNDCEPGKFGPGCLRWCHCQGDACDGIDGRCQSKCEDGWVGKSCQRRVFPADTTSVVIIITELVLICCLIPIIYMWGKLYHAKRVQEKIKRTAELPLAESAPPRPAVPTPVEVRNNMLNNKADKALSAHSGPSLEHIISSTGRPIKVQELQDRVEDLKSRKNAFKEEYMQIPFGKQMAWKTAQDEFNMDKNRFQNIMAYDHSRVPLEESDVNFDLGDYINANFIMAYKDRKQGYIAAQGPLPETVVDMWRMIWQYKVNRVVMVTKTMEDCQVKSECYWPNKETMDDLQVALTKTETFADYIIRTVTVSRKDESLSVTHFQFLGWPDHDVPVMATGLLEFHHKVRSYDRTASGPLLVHCSAGVGRTGTFLALDYLLEQAKAEGQIDVYKYTALMRTCRVNMIQTLSQYKFVYTALLEALMSGNHVIPRAELPTLLPSLLKTQDGNQSQLEKQFQVLDIIKPPEEKGLMDGQLEENIHKNRDSKVIPSDYHRPHLMGGHEEKDNYINAAFIPGYRQSHALIATQMPLHDTIGDFWRLLHGHGSHSVITLYDFDNTDPEDEMCQKYWPGEVGQKLDFKTLDVEMEASEKLSENLIQRQFKIRTKNEEASDFSHVVRQFHLLGWPEEVVGPEEPAAVLHLLEAVELWQEEAGGGPITVQCKNGVDKTGVLCAARFVMEKILCDEEVDVFLAVAQTRLARPQFITSSEQYEFLHRLAVQFVNRT